MSKLISKERYRGKDGIMRDLWKLWDDGMPWFIGMMPHFKRLFIGTIKAPWKIYHNALNVLSEASRVQPGGKYDAPWVYSHVLGIPLLTWGTIKVLVLAWAMVFPSAQAQPMVTIDGNTYQLNIDAVQMSSRVVFDCPEPTFHPDDFDSDGDLDDTCYGLTYDPCDHESLYVSLVEFQQGGGHCQTKDEFFADPCDGFGPFPQECSIQ